MSGVWRSNIGQGEQDNTASQQQVSQSANATDIVKANEKRSKVGGKVEC